MVGCGRPGAPRPHPDLFTAEYEGWPSEQTALLLAERYPSGTPGKYQFPLSAAVEFLRAGGKAGLIVESVAGIEVKVYPQVTDPRGEREVLRGKREQARGKRERPRGEREVDLHKQDHY